MIRKLLFVFAAVWLMTSLSTPEAMKETWNTAQAKIPPVDQWSENIQEWLEEKEIQWEQSLTLNEFFSRYLDFGQIPEEQATPVPVPNQTQEEQQRSLSLSEYRPSEFEREVVKLVNDERTERGLNRLEIHDRLSGLAKIKSQDMAEKEYFSHTSPTYGSPFEMMQKYNFTFRMAGENIAAGQRSPEQVVEGWMNSKGHRENILNGNFTHIGVGYVEASGPYRTYWTQLFMTPK